MATIMSCLVWLFCLLLFGTVVPAKTTLCQHAATIFCHFVPSCQKKSHQKDGMEELAYKQFLNLTYPEINHFKLLVVGNPQHHGGRRKRELEDREDHGLSQALCLTGCLWKWSTSASPGWVEMGQQECIKKASKIEKMISLSWKSVSVALPGQVPFLLFFPNWDFINLFFFQKDEMPGLGLGVGSSSICTWLDVGSATRRKNLSWLSDDVQPQTVRIYRCWDDYRRADIRQLVKNLSAPRWTWIVWTLDQFWKLIICVHIILWWCMWIFSIFWYGIYKR